MISPLEKKICVERNLIVLLYASINPKTALHEEKGFSVPVLAHYRKALLGHILGTNFITPDGSIFPLDKPENNKRVRFAQ